MQAKDLEGFLSENERERAERKERLLLHGPQHEGQAIGQSDVDSLLTGKTAAA
jgi:chemotaxis protein CheZ